MSQNLSCVWRALGLMFWGSDPSLDRFLGELILYRLDQTAWVQVAWFHRCGIQPWACPKMFENFGPHHADIWGQPQFETRAQ